MENKDFELINLSKNHWDQIIGNEYENIVFAKGPKDHENNRKAIKADLDGKASGRIKEITKDNSIMVYVFMLAVYKIALSRMFSGVQFAIGIPQYIKDKSIPANNKFLLSSNIPHKGKSFKEVLVNEKDALLSEYKYEFYPLEQMYTANNTYEKINVYCVMENLHSNLQIEDILHLSNNDITLIVKNNKDSIDLTFKGADDIEDAQVDILKNIFINILQHVIEDLNVKVEEVDIISKEEMDRLLVDFNNTDTEYPKDKSISELFEMQVEKTPDHTALIFRGEKLTYREMNERANTVAALLKERNVKLGDAVGLMVERSFEMIVGIMAILKAGGAYVPIDHEYPEDRINYILEDSNLKILLGQGKLLNKVNLNCEVIDFDEPGLPQSKPGNLHTAFKGGELAYIIYTSGSTGKPKGTLIKQYSVTRVVKNTNYIHIDKNDVLLGLSSYVFDGSVFDICGTLLNGAALVIPEKESILDIEKLGALIEKEKISVFFTTTALFNSLVDISIKSLQNIRKVLFGGERVSLRHTKKALEALGSGKIIHVYGPTESTVYATYYPVDHIREEDLTVPIGKPLSNTKLYVVGENNKLQPVGVQGELCIAGDGLAVGYLNRKDLTEEKFVKNPFEAGSIMYRTGDLVKWLPDGDIEFIDRIDQQVKIRGFRIELGEIESALLAIDGIREAMVLVKVREDNKYLCAYYVAENEYSEGFIRDELKKSLPGFMIPSSFIRVEKMPLTINGKIDKKKLVEIEEDTGKALEYEVPRNAVEAQLADIWQDVLGRDRVGINDNFFEIGGHSLNAIKVVGRIHKELNTEVPLNVFFNIESIKELAEYLASVNKKEYRGIKKIEEKEYYEVSSAQKRIYLVQELEPDSNTYNITEAMEVTGKLDLPRLAEGLKKLIEKQEILRTSFHVIDGAITQKIHSFDEIDFQIEEIPISEEKDINQKVKEFARPFDLKKAPLLRAGVISLEEERHILLFDIHHIIADGTSIAIMLNQLADYDKNGEFAASDIQYKDYVSWQNKFAQTDEMKAQEKYWLDVFKGEIPVMEMPVDYKRPNIRSFDGDTVVFKISSQTTGRLKKIAKESGATLYMVLLAAYTILLSKYTGKEDIIVGSPSAGRNNSDLQDMVGMFVNTIAMRNHPRAEKTFKAYLKEVKENTLKAFENQDYQFDELVDALGITRDASKNSLFDTMLVLQNIDEIKFEFGDLKLQGFLYKNDISKFDLVLNLTEEKDEIRCDLEYCTKLFKRTTIERFVNCFNNLLDCISDSTDLPLGDISILSREEKDMLVYQFNNTKVPYPENKGIHQLFEDQVIKTPDNIAVVYEENILTYKQLNEASNQLARVLREKGVTRNTIVGILINRSVEMVIGIMAILKAGSAYLPIDPEYPEDRIQYILDDSKVSILLTQGEIKKEFIKGKEIVNILDDGVYDRSNENLENINLVNDLAYVIYTSGSTGKPKGVMVEHKGIANLKVYFEKEYGISGEDSIIQFASCSFDAAVWELNMALQTGASSYIVPRSVIDDLNRFEEFLNTNKITVATLPPVYASNIRVEKIKTMRLLITAGSEANFDLVGKWNKKVKYVNAYGPTETTVCASAWIDDGADYSARLVPIGKPIYNTQIYIMDRSGKPQPVGVNGELCVGGVGLARGYINMPELTKEKFISNPLNEEEFIYRTGDIARWLPDGNIEFLGRVDNQVKIRGYRVELEEVERQMLLNKNVKEAVALAKKDSNDQYFISCYYVADKEIAPSELRMFLLKELPEYMVPSRYMQLKSIPKNQSGKPDKRPLMQLSGEPVSEEKYEGSTNEYEELLIGIWHEIFERDGIGINDDFFSLGGDSIKAIKALYLLNDKNMTLKMGDIFKYRTIKKLAEIMAPMGNKPVQGDTFGKFKITPIQQWFFDSHKIHPEHFHQAILLKSNESLNVEALRDILTEIQKYHDALRVRYTLDGDEMVGEVLDSNYPLNYQVICIEDMVKDKETVNKKIIELQESVNFKTGPLMNTLVFKTKERDYVYILIHHLAVDTVSWGILINDIQNLYRQFLNKQPYKFARKTTSIKEWSERIHQYSNSKKFLEEMRYWKDIQKKAVQSIPFDFAHDTNTVRDSKTCKIVLGKEETEILLKKISNQYKASIVDILLSSLSFALYHWTGNRENAVIFEGHGREDLFDNISLQRTVGWFTSIYPIVLEAPESGGLIECLDKTMLVRNSIPNNGVGYSILRYLTDEENKEYMDWSLTPQVGFNYLGVTDMENRKGLLEVVDSEYGSSASYDSERHFELELNSYISNEELKILLTYNSKAYKPETINRLIHSYKEKLQAYARMNSEQIEKDSFKNNLKYFMDNYNAPGIIVGVKSPDGDTYIASEGQSDIFNKINMSSTVNFKIGSLTKTFVSTIVLQLVEEGLIALEASLMEYIPELLEKYPLENFRKITVKRLLNHTSGIKDYIKNPAFIKKLAFNSKKVWRKEELANYGLSMYFDPEPTDRIWVYSSTGYILLGLIIERVTGLSLEENIQTRICNPLGLTHTKLVNRLDSLDNFSHCYTNEHKPSGNLLQTVVSFLVRIGSKLGLVHTRRDLTNRYLTVGWAAGGMISNARELLKWLDAFVEGSLLKDKKLIHDYIDISMHYPENYDVKMGLGIFHVNGMSGHEGHGVGFQNVIYKYNGYGIVIHLNQEAVDRNNVISEPHQIVSQLIKLLR